MSRRCPRLPALDPVDELLAALMAADRQRVDTLVASTPALTAQAIARYPGKAIAAARFGRLEAVPLLVERGFDVNARMRTTALHEAAWRDDRALIDVLLDLGADPTIRDTERDTTPAGWAASNGHEGLAALLGEAELGWRATPTPVD